MSGGKKNDKNKPPLDLIPYEMEEELAKVLAFGANLYGRHNWRDGMEYSRLTAATKRHLGKFNNGIDLDDESGLSHIAHAIANLTFLLWMQKHRPDKDDRWKK